ncbi:MAG: twin transmembrane helix small protein [Pseudomonadota bacterium]
MEQVLSILLYIAAAGLLVVLALGIINLTRRDERQASRSNMLMRWRIGIQAVAIVILVAMGVAAGAISFGG